MRGSMLRRSLLDLYQDYCEGVPDPTEGGRDVIIRAKAALAAKWKEAHPNYRANTWQQYARLQLSRRARSRP